MPHNFFGSGPVLKPATTANQAVRSRARNAVEDLNVQVIRSYSWAATESPKKLAV